MELLLSDGSHATIEEISIEKLAQPDTTYNFEVKDFHTYYVANSKVLVHNDCDGTHYNSQQEAYAAAKNDLGIPLDENPMRIEIKYYDDGTGYFSQQTMEIFSGNRVIVNHPRGHVFDGKVLGPHYNIGYYAPQKAHGYIGFGKHYFY